MLMGVKSVAFGEQTLRQSEYTVFPWSDVLLGTDLRIDQQFFTSLLYHNYEVLNNLLKVHLMYTRLFLVEF